jgi:molecular chaperone IbpA
MPLDTVTSINRYAFGVSKFETRLIQGEISMNTTLNALFPQLETISKSLDPFTVGYDKFFVDLGDITKDMAKKVQTYPPYNIKQINKNKYVIELAVAGFAKQDIEVTLDGNKLIVKGNAKEDNLKEEETYFFKGIANRGFERSFTLADKIEIKDADMVNGMLRIWLESLVQTQDAIKKIAIKEKKDE